MSTKYKWPTIKPDTLGHRTRISMDSSLYDEVCVLCGATDADRDRGLEKPCPSAVFSLET